MQTYEGSCTCYRKYVIVDANSNANKINTSDMFSCKCYRKYVIADIIRNLIFYLLNSQYIITDNTKLRALTVRHVQVYKSKQH